MKDGRWQTLREKGERKIKGNIRFFLDDEKLGLSDEDLKLIRSRPVFGPEYDDASDFRKDENRREALVKIIRCNAILRVLFELRHLDLQLKKRGGREIYSFDCDVMTVDQETGCLLDYFPKKFRNAVSSVTCRLHFYVATESERRACGIYHKKHDGEIVASVRLEWVAEKTGRYVLYGQASTFADLSKLLAEIRTGTVYPEISWCGPQVREESLAPVPNHNTSFWAYVRNYFDLSA